MIFFLFILSLATASAADQVTLVLKNGGNRTGEIIFADDHQIRLKIALGEQGDATATVSIPRSAMNTIEFESDPAMEQLLGSPNPTHTEELDMKISLRYKKKRKAIRHSDVNSLTTSI